MNFLVSEATGTAEQDAIPVLLDEAREFEFHPKTLGAGKGDDTGSCVGSVRARGVTPDVAQNTSGHSSASRPLLAEDWPSLFVLSTSWARIRRRVGDMRAAAREMGPGESREVPI